jgi:RNA polymerase sigma-70 factor (ECF subfamily)
MNTKEFNQFYNSNYNKVLTYVKSKVNGKIEIAEEITSDSFIKAYKSIDVFDEKQAQITTWLFTIVNNTIIDYYRANKHSSNKVSMNDYTNEEGKEFFVVSDNVQADNEIQNKELSNKINSAIEDLNPLQKAIAELFFLEDKNQKEIADFLKLSHTNVRVNVFRIKEVLQNKLQNNYLD